MTARHVTIGLAMAILAGGLIGCEQAAVEGVDVVDTTIANQQKLDEIQLQLVQIQEQLDSGVMASPSIGAVQLNPVDSAAPPPPPPTGDRIVNITAGADPVQPNANDINPFNLGQQPVYEPAPAPRRTPTRRSASTGRSLGKSYKTLAAKHVRVSGVQVRDVQLALKRANINPGPVDNKMGKKTISAIRNFQQANGLKVDGVVGRQTWSKLRPYIAG